MLKIQEKHSLVGKRSENQDAVLVKEFENGDTLLAVADGMGGGVMGAELSCKAVAMLDEFFTTSKLYPQTKLDKAVYSINEVLHEMLEGQKGGTTLCVVYYLYASKKLHFINVGDSRLSVCIDGMLRPITLDQNEYEEKKLKNEYADEEDKRWVCNILGITPHKGETGEEGKKSLEALFADARWSAVGEHTLSEGEYVLLSTDGFHEYMDEEIFCEMLDLNFEKILENVKKRSGDNISLIMAKEI